MTAHQNNNQHLNDLNLLKTISEKDRSISKLHQDNVESFSKFSDQSSQKKLNRILEKLKNYEELEFQKILIMRVINKTK